MTDIVVEVEDTSWEKVVEKGPHPSIVMFYSPTCPYCRIIEPYFREYSNEYRDIVTFVRLNVAASAWTAERFAVRATPTFKFFCQGRAIAEMVGAIYPALLKKLIDDALAHGKECVQNSTVIDYDISGYA
ncbi:MAG: thioredoxin family protein [Methanomicrobiales archaeon]|nr:thioredoxin family protein [Methanomicrobiales archaeon]